MKPKAWYNFLNEERSAFEEKGCVFGLSGSDFFLLTLRGRSNQDEILRTSESIRNGQALDTFDGDDIALLPIDAVDRIEVKGKSTVVVKSSLDDRKDLHWPISEDQSSGETVAREIATTSGRPFQESRQDVSLGSAISVPVMAGLFSVLLTVVLFTVSYSIESGEEVAAQGRGAAFKALFVAVASTLGVKGSLAVGIVAITTAVAYGIFRIFNRPQFTVIEFSKQNAIRAA